MMKMPLNNKKIKRQLFTNNKKLNNCLKINQNKYSANKGVNNKTMRMKIVLPFLIKQLPFHKSSLARSRATGRTSKRTTKTFNNSQLMPTMDADAMITSKKKVTNDLISYIYFL
jgi:hypothetical protein